MRFAIKDDKMTSRTKRRSAPEPREMIEGRELFNAGRFADACARFEAARRLRPSPPSAADALAQSLRGLAEAFALEGRWDQALAAYSRARRLAPKDSALLLGLARLQLRLGRGAQAEALLRKAIALKAGSEARLMLGELLKVKGMGAEARAQLRRAAAGKAEAPDARALLAAGITRFQANVKLGAYERAFREAESLLSALGTQECIDSFFISPERAEMMPTLEALKALSAEAPADPWPRYFRAALLTNMGRGEEAIAETEALRGAPARYHWMRHRHGEFLLTSRRDYAGAEAEYAAALECVPGFWKARAALAEIALCRGDRAAALRRADELVEALPERSKPWGLACRGRLLLWLGEYERGLASLEPAVAAGVPGAALHRGGALLLLGRLAEAAGDLEADSASGTGAEALTWRGELRRLTGRLKEAGEALSAAIRLDGSNSVWALADRALVKGAAGDAAGMWTDYTTIRRDALERFERAAGAKPAGPADAEAMRSVLEAGLRLARGLRASNEHLFPLWMGRP